MNEYAGCCVTVSYGRVPSSYKWHPVYGLAIYRKSIRKRDGVKIWRYQGHYGGTRRSYKLVCQDAQALSQSLSIPYLVGIRHNQVVRNQDEIRGLSC